MSLLNISAVRKKKKLKCKWRGFIVQMCVEWDQYALTYHMCQVINIHRIKVFWYSYDMFIVYQCSRYVHDIKQWLMKKWAKGKKERKKNINQQSLGSCLWLFFCIPFCSSFPPHTLCGCLIWFSGLLIAPLHQCADRLMKDTKSKRSIKGWICQMVACQIKMLVARQQWNMCRQEIYTPLIIFKWNTCLLYKFYCSKIEALAWGK